ncbi:WD40 repeat domain-containing protein [Sulfurimonas sp. NWX367]|uniref:WD40 repeat domain-containing protein n=1 Tax=Sulfurimonas sp. NWX367 TaxID=2925413 RepID=UPI00320480E5
MKTVKSQSIVYPVILIKILKDKRLVVIDAKTTVRFYDKDSLKVQSGFKVNIEHKYYKNNVVDYSYDGNYFATMSADAKESRLYNAQTKKAIARVTRHQGEVSCVGIDPLSRYMFSCGEDGKTFALDVKSGKIVFTLPHHADTINDVSFSKNGNWVAIASYDRKITLFNLVTMTPKEKLKAHSAPVMKLKFFGRNKLVSIDKNSKAIIWNIYSGKVIQRLEGIHDDVTQLVISGDEKFLFLSTKLGYILVYDLNTYELIAPRFIKITSPIVSLAFDDEHNHLIVGTEDGFLMYYDIFEKIDTLKNLLMKQDIDAIEEEVKKNPILRYTDIYNLVSNLWENTLEKAKKAFQNGKKEQALLMLKNFMKIPSKNRVIQKLVSDYAEYDKFVQLAKNGKLALAYSLANQYPVYKESKIYKLLEERWKKDLFQALKYALQPNQMERAKEILAPYRGISNKTTFIQDVLTKGAIYKRFRNALGKKDFKLASALVHQNPFLKEFPEYDSMIKYADTIYMKIQKLVYEGENIAAMKLMNLLSTFTDFKDEVELMLKEIQNKQKFYDAVESGDYQTAYNMMAEYEELQETKAGEKLQNEWDADLIKANSFAAVGDVNGVKNILHKYFDISSKTTALATIFAWTYINQLETAIREKRDRKEIENGIKNYILNFGIDDQIEILFEIFKKRYKDTKLDIEQLKKGSLSMWRPSMIVKSILD